MAAINDLIRQIEDKNLRDRLQQEVARLSKQKKFGLVFEDHIPECTPLYGVAVRKGSLVAAKGEDIRNVYFVSAIFDGRAAIVNKATGEKSERPLDTLVAVAQFGEPIFPSLIPMDSVENAPESSLWHTLIEADNFHALQLLEYLYPKQVDCIYIDPPYNTGARDWKYNNDYVDAADSYRHSKWLSMMQRRLKIAKRLLNPENSVMIVTIDEKEYLHLGCLLEEMFPEARIQMISTMINPAIVARAGEFGRSGEYIFFVLFGKASPARIKLDREWVSSKGRTHTGNIRWDLLKRSGTGATRKDSPGGFYPIYIDPEDGKIVKIGDPLPDGISEAPQTSNLYCLLPIRDDGSEGRWQWSTTTLADGLNEGRVKVGGDKKRGFTVYRLAKAEYEKVLKGEFEIIGRGVNNEILVDDIDTEQVMAVPGDIWKISSHDSTQYGSRLLGNIFTNKRFTFPKSLYAVKDCLHFFTANNPDALIVDFFAGSGTTLHAVNLLNAEDGGKRRCILVTNNEVSDDEGKALKKQGYQPGDEEWEKLGIARYVTWPRTVCSIKGVDVNGDELRGNYGCEIEKMIEVDGEITDPDTGKKLRGTFYKKAKEAIYPALSRIKMADGFATNAEYFKLGFLDKSSVALGQQFREILPMLWLKAGAVGKRPVLADGEIPDMLIPENSNFAVLIDERYFGAFLAQIEARPDIEYVYLVTNSEDAYREMGARIRTRNVTQLYRDYIDNFVINSRRI